MAFLRKTTDKLIALAGAVRCHMFEILKLQDYPCRNKVVYSSRSYSNIPYVHTMQGQDPLDVQCTDKDRFGIRTFEKQFDYVRFLNS